MPGTRHALYYRRPGSRRWVLFDVFPSREEAFAAVDRVPMRHPSVWITPVAPAEEAGHRPESAMTGLVTEGDAGSHTDARRIH